MNVDEFPLYHYRATVMRITTGETIRDGDTFVCMLDHGRKQFGEVSIRVLYADAPERKGLTLAAGEAATVWLTEHVLGQRIWLKSRWDRLSYERLLAEVWYAPDAHGELRNLAADMIAAGQAVPTDGSGHPITTGETA